MHRNFQSTFSSKVYPLFHMVHIYPQIYSIFPGTPQVGVNLSCQIGSIFATYMDQI